MERFGFEEEGFRRSNIEKDGVRLGVHFLGLQRSVWLERRADLRRSYKAILEKFGVDIEWKDR